MFLIHLRSVHNRDSPQLMYRGLFIEPIPKFDVKVTNEREKIPKFDNLSIEITVVLNGKKHSVFINPVCFRHI